MVDPISPLIDEQFRELTTNSRIIIIHPNYRQRRHLFSLFWEVPNVHYWCPVIHNGFNRESLSEQVKTQLAGLKTVPEMLLIDDADRIGDESLEAILVDYLATYKNSSIALFTRTVPVCTQSNGNLRKMTRYLPVDDSLLLPDYASRDTAQNLLEVHAFGLGRVLLNGQLIDNWDGQLPRALFYYLVDKGMATRDDIFQTFWPNLTKREATNVFHVTKRKISEILGVSLTVYSSGFYRISPDIELIYDAVQFFEMVQNSAVVAEKAMQELLLRAIWLYRSDFLMGMDMEWVLQRRAQLRQMKSDALVTLAKEYHHAKDWDAALGRYIQAFATQELRDDVVTGAMQVYQHQRKNRDALIVYKHFEQRLNGTLKISPSAALKKLMNEIQADIQD